MRTGPAIYAYCGVRIGGEAWCDGVASAYSTRHDWPLTPTCWHRLLLDLRFFPVQRGGEAYTRSPLRSCWAGQFVYRIIDVAPAEAEPLLALLRCFLPLAK
jgi:hypothetical protein